MNNLIEYDLREDKKKRGKGKEKKEFYFHCFKYSFYFVSKFFYKFYI